MERYIDANKLEKAVLKPSMFDINKDDVIALIAEQPAADVVEIETLRSWLYSIAINNVNCDVQMTLSEACEDIISRLDGLRNFARERRTDNDLL